MENPKNTQKPKIKVKEKKKPLLTALAKLVEPGRDVTITQLGGMLVKTYHDEVGANTYKLAGLYSYDEVVALNELAILRKGDTTFKLHCGFGYCKELGNIAFIGIINSDFCTRSGYFEYNVHSYGTSLDERTLHFELYSDEEAKKATDYTVYGMEGAKEVSAKAPIAHICYSYDSRYTQKISGFHQHPEKTLLDMDLKLSGTYTFDEARLLATGTTEDKEWFNGEDHPIKFAVVDDNMYIGIINYSVSPRENMQFRDVWEYGCDEPPVQKLRFLSKEEAKAVNKFILYVYVYPYSLKTKNYPIEKQDRTFDSRFDFRLPDGRDMRFI